MFRFDQSDPQFLVIYSGDTHPQTADYAAMAQLWIARLDAYERSAERVRFGLIVVHEPHQHDADENHARDGEEEAAFSKLINDFRRDQRDRISQICTGYTNIYRAEEVIQWYGAVETGLAELQEHGERFAQYTFGIPSGVFLAVDEAKSWLKAQSLPSSSLSKAQSAKDEPITTAAVAHAHNVGLFYGSTTAVTQFVAEQVATAWQAAGGAALLPINISDVKNAAYLLDYDYLLLGIPTWNIGQLQDDWALLLPCLEELDFSGKQVALFGVGDAHGYPANFLDAMGMLGVTLLERNAELVGFWPTAGYSFTESKAVIGDQFMGLAIDEVNRSEQTSPRIERWVRQIIGEFAIDDSATLLTGK